MRTKSFLFFSAITFFSAALGLSQAQAEMGKAPAGATDFYLSVFGGYVYQEGPRVNAYASQVGVPRYTFAVQDGGFVGADLGFILGNAIVPFGLENARIEASFSTNIFDTYGDNRTDARLESVDDTSAVGSAAAPARATQKREVYDGSIALKGEIGGSEAVDLTGAIEFFVRGSEDTSTHFVNIFGGSVRNASVDARYFGTMFALQPEFQFGNGLSFATDFAAGFYVLQADGKFTDNFGAVRSLSDSSTNVGFRGRLGGTLKAKVTSRVTASLFGVVDYWSDTAFANMPEVNTSLPFTICCPSKVGLEGLMEAKAGARLTIALGGN